MVRGPVGGGCRLAFVISVTTGSRQETAWRSEPAAPSAASASSLNPELRNTILLDGVFIELDTEPRFLRDIKHAVAGDDALLGDFVAQRRLFFSDELEDK